MPNDVDFSKVGRLKKGAIFSRNREHRYVLWRIWDPKKPMILFVGLNPSIASGYEEDHTTTKLQKFCRMSGYGGYYLVNLFTRIATDFDDLKFESSLNTALSDRQIEKYARMCTSVCLMWGGKGIYKDRDKEVLSILKNLPPELLCFKLTCKDHPHHPLMLGYKDHSFKPLTLRKLQLSYAVHN